MAMKAMLFLLASLLLVTIRVSAVEGIPVPDEKAPAPSPKQPPFYPPKGAPAHAPMPPVHPPMKAPPAYPPAKAEGPQPPSYQECSHQCVAYCDLKGKQKRDCQRICTPCCKKCKCVPFKGKVCYGWDEVEYHKKMVKCPVY